MPKKQADARRACDTAHDPDPWQAGKFDPRPWFCQDRHHYGKSGS